MKYMMMITQLGSWLCTCWNNVIKQKKCEMGGVKGKGW